MSEKFSSRALSDQFLVKEFSSWLLSFVGESQAALQSVSVADKSFAVSGYGVLMELYGLRTRAYILMNDPGAHVVSCLDFSQEEMLSLFDRVSSVVRTTSTLKSASAMVLSVATFTVSLGEGRGKIVSFLFKTLCDEVSGWEASLCDGR
ncbi:hypothetical protein F7R01_16780 [Pseudomonas argentinensis]|uniref:hypothetical protein n=1 Tax=Phytopseudomonas argentinensis TaxID=289370 RepID=UPI001113AD3D|nr:hypothetical protein [Pseudomonas argentinensis]KAB0549072.1 hypothetical protein F7R01_16780 [Pseudomonas argentinensis]